MQISASILLDSSLLSRTCTKKCKPPQPSQTLISNFLTQQGRQSLSLCLQYGNCQQSEIRGDCWDHIVVSNLLGMEILF